MLWCGWIKLSLGKDCFGFFFCMIYYFTVTRIHFTICKEQSNNSNPALSVWSTKHCKLLGKSIMLGLVNIEYKISMIFIVK